MKGYTAIRTASTSSRNLAKKIALWASDAKAEDIIVLDMRHQVSFCDFFVIASGNSDRHVGAIADRLEEELDALGLKPRVSNGKQRSNWIVFDAGDIVAHIFHKEVRAFYNLEGLWQDAKHVNWQK